MHHYGVLCFSLDWPCTGIDMLYFSTIIFICWNFELWNVEVVIFINPWQITASTASTVWDVALDSTLFSLWIFLLYNSDRRVQKYSVLLVWSATQSCRLFDRVTGPSGRPISRGTTVPDLKPRSSLSFFLSISPLHPTILFSVPHLDLIPPVVPSACRPLPSGLILLWSMQPPPPPQQNQRGNGGINCPPQSSLPRLSPFSFLFTDSAIVIQLGTQDVRVITEGTHPNGRSAHWYMIRWAGRDETDARWPGVTPKVIDIQLWHWDYVWEK